MKISTIVCLALLVVLLNVCSHLTDGVTALGLPGSELQILKKKLVRNVADADPICPPPITRTDASVAEFLQRIANLKCLDEKITNFDSFIEESALPLTYSQITKIINAFSTFQFVKVHITSILINRMVSIKSSEAVTLINAMSKTELEKFNSFSLVKKKISDLKDQSSAIISLFTDETIKQNVIKEIEALKQVKSNCLFSNVDANRVIFVIDVSISMTAIVNPTESIKMSRLDFVKKHLISAIRELKPHQYFQVIYFSGTAYRLVDEIMVQATEANIERCIGLVAKLSSAPATNISNALTAAFIFLERFETPNSAIYLLSDGIPVAGIQDVTEMKNWVSVWVESLKCNVHTVSFLLGTYDESETNAVKEEAAQFMSTIAIAGRGTFTRIQA